MSRWKGRIRELRHGAVEVVRGLARRTGLYLPREERALRRVRAEVAPGDPAGVLACLDRFAREEAFLMNLGPEKAPLVRRLVAEHGVRRALELGSYVGYGAVVLGEAVGPGGSVVTVEASRRHAEVTRAMVRHAGLADRVEVVSGRAEQVIPRLRDPFDLVLLDHAKEAYLADLQRLERRGLLAPGAVVVADNTGMFADELGPYLDWVRDPARYRSRSHPFTMEYRPEVPDAVEVSVRQG